MFLVFSKPNWCWGVGTIAIPAGGLGAVQVRDRGVHRMPSYLDTKDSGPGVTQSSPLRSEIRVDEITAA